MKKTKRIVSLLLAVLMIALMIPIATVSVSASTGGHSQADAVNWVNAQVWKSLDYDGAYGAQCVDLIMFYYQYLGTSSPGGDARDYRSNALPSGWQRINYYSGLAPNPGDICVWGPYQGPATSEFGHVGIVTSGNSSTFNSVEQNVDGQYVQTIYNRTTSSVACFIRPDFVSDTSAPTISNARAENVSGSSFTIKCDLYDDVGVTRVWVVLYGPHGEAQFSVPASNGAFSHTISTADYGGPGEYAYGFYAQDAAGNSTKGLVEPIYAIDDTVAPTISNARAENVSSDSFDIKCDLYDNIGVTRVWFVVYGPHGEAQYGVNASNGSFTHTIHTADFGGPGEYGVGFYAFDAADNGTKALVEPIYAYTEKTAYYKNNKYELFNIKMTWQQAKSECERRGGHLVYINSSEENELVTGLAEGFKYYIWLGATDEQREGYWYWTNGDMLSYSNWNSGEPNNSAAEGGPENYLQLLVSGESKGKWNDSANNSDTVAGFVCEYDDYYMTGDANGDSKINVRDVTAIQRFVGEFVQFTDEQLAAADVDGNGIVDINDATHLQMYLAEYNVVLG